MTVLVDEIAKIFIFIEDGRLQISIVYLSRDSIDL